MKTRQKIHFDRLVGTPLAAVINLAARLLGRVMRRSHALPPEAPKLICAAKFVGMGSILCAHSMLQALRVRFPGARLIFITSSKNRELIERMPVIDECIYIDERSISSISRTTFLACLRFWRRRPDLYFDLELYSYYSSIVANLSFALNRLGFYRRSADFKLGLFTHLLFFNTAVSVQLLYMQLARVAGTQAAGPDIAVPALTLHDSDIAQAERALHGWLPPGAPLLVVNPNASDLCLERRWPAENVGSAVRELMDRIPNLKVVLTGAPEDRPHTELVLKHINASPDRVRTTAGNLSLGGLLGLLSLADCVLTNDTGPMHMAIALKCRTVALFGPEHPRHYLSYCPPDRTVVLYQPVACSPCIWHADEPPCGGDNQCMKQIQPASVVKACFTLLMHGRVPEGTVIPQRWLPGPDPNMTSLTGSPLGVVERTREETIG